MTTCDFLSERAPALIPQLLLNLSWHSSQSLGLNHRAGFPRLTPSRHAPFPWSKHFHSPDMGYLDCLGGKFCTRTPHHVHHTRRSSGNTSTHSQHKKLGEYEHHTSHSQHKKLGEYELHTIQRHISSCPAGFNKGDVSHRVTVYSAAHVSLSLFFSGFSPVPSCIFCSPSCPVCPHNVQ